MAKQKFSSLAAMYDEVVQHVVDDCVLCGECVNDCLTYPLSPIKDISIIIRGGANHRIKFELI